MEQRSWKSAGPCNGASVCSRSDEHGLSFGSTMLLGSVVLVLLQIMHPPSELQVLAGACARAGERARYQRPDTVAHWNARNEGALCCRCL